MITNPSQQAATQTGAIACPKCGHTNTNSASFCTQCHYVLIRRCPNCWHEQREGLRCEKCGTNFALYGELKIEESMAEENRLWWANFWAGVSVYVQVLLLPFMTVGGLLRSLLLRIISTRLSNR
ncbi:MAG: double zinc ribbon domain-containing protein [Candidatus Acidiferrales bacterium]